MLKQRTLRNSIKAVGIGLHTGKNINLELIPAEINSGINFIRTDVDENLIIPAIAENVGDTSLSTALVKDDVKFLQLSICCQPLLVLELIIVSLRSMVLKSQ